RSRRSSGRGSRERVRALGSDRAHELLGAARTNEVDRPPVAEERIESEQPGERRLALVQAEKAPPDELEEVDLLRIEGVDAGAAQPTCHLRAAHAEHH